MDVTKDPLLTFTLTDAGQLEVGDALDVAIIWEVTFPDPLSWTTPWTPASTSPPTPAADVLLDNISPFQPLGEAPLFEYMDPVFQPEIPTFQLESVASDPPFEANRLPELGDSFPPLPPAPEPSRSTPTTSGKRVPMYSLDPDAEPDPKMRQRIRRAIRCKRHHEGVKRGASVNRPLLDKCLSVLEQWNRMVEEEGVGGDTQDQHDDFIREFVRDSK